MMNWTQLVLADLIRRGKVTVDIPGMDMDRLCEAISNPDRKVLDEIRRLVSHDDLTDREKVEAIQAHLYFFL